MNAESRTKPLYIAISEGVPVVGAIDELTGRLENPAQLVRQVQPRQGRIAGTVEIAMNTFCVPPYGLLSMTAIQLTRGVKLLSVDDDILPGERKEILQAYQQCAEMSAKLRSESSGAGVSSGLIIQGVSK